MDVITSGMVLNAWLLPLPLSPLESTSSEALCMLRSSSFSADFPLSAGFPQLSAGFAGSALPTALDNAESANQS